MTYYFLVMSNLSTPQPKQARAKETIDLLIKATDRAMREGGESAVRIQELSDATGVSIGSIYHHFGDRDGLIRATHAHNFASVIAADIPRVKEFISRMSSTAEMAEHYEEMLNFVKSHFSVQSALERAAIVGNTAGRPKLQQELGEVQTQLTDGVTEVMVIAQERNMLKEHLNPRAAATVMLGILFGKAIAELDNNPVSEHDWSRAMLSAFGGMLVIREGN